MSDNKATATKFGAEAASRAARRDVPPSSFNQESRRAVGVYDRPARRARLSLPLVVILILSALVSVVAAARFLF
ncbi:MAG TPA: hypothetical protein VGW12_20825 [Pyrinomonadaceae bacterium]|nr:hypothetical protein [Pyrinomonadaceae bacterium]